MIYQEFIHGAVAILLTASGVVHSAITITSPANNVKLAAGADYATDVLGDPWDMANPEDVSISPDDRGGWASFGFPGNGTSGGVTSSSDTAVFFLGQGLYGINNPGRNGIRFPVDTSIYKKISFKMYSSIAGATPQVYWFHTSPGNPNQSFGELPASELTSVGYKIFMPTDLTGPPQLGQPWSQAPLVGLRIDHNVGPVGQTVYFDWVRLTLADNDTGAVRLPIIWSGATAPVTVEVEDSSGVILNIARNAASPISWNYGVLPPGSYTIRVIGGNGSAAAAFRINSPPATKVAAPDETGGNDFATTVIGNGWDMNGPEDVVALSGISNISFANGVLTGTSTNSDPGIVLFNSNTATVIDSSRYRYLTYRIKIDGPYDLGNGSVVRAFWSSTFNPTGSLVTTTKDIIAWPGVDPSTPDFVTYTLDLGALTTSITNGGLESMGAAEQWGTANIRYLRIDPHEFSTPRSFQLDYVRLTAMREAGNSFVIAYAASDANTEDSNAQVKLYYATDKNPANRQLIVSGLPLSNAGQYVWNLSSVTPGVYYLYSEVSDGLDTRGSYSTGQLRVLPPTGPAGPLDIDGDGRYDASTDGVLILRYLLGFRGNSLTNGAIGAGASRNATQILTQLDTIRPQLDVDGNGRFEATTDGLMLVRYLLGLRNPALTAGTVAAGATQQTLDQIQANIQALAP